MEVIHKLNKGNSASLIVFSTFWHQKYIFFEVVAYLFIQK